jgi:TP901 family phage tail tape measure protein
MAEPALTLTTALDTRRAERDGVLLQRKLSRYGDIRFNIGGNAQLALGRISGAADDFQKSLAAANARVLAFGLSVGILSGITRSFFGMVNATRSVEKSLTNINVILGASSANLAKFGDSLFKIASSTGQSFDVAAEAATEFARQGLGLQETLKRTRDALILVRLSGGDAASAVDSLTATINSFSKSALDSTKVVNQLANVDAAFAVSAGDLAEAIKRTGSTAQDAGVSFEELIALVATAREITGRSGQVIGNSFKTIFQRIQRPQVLAQLESLGVAIRDQNGEILPAIQLLQGLGSQYDSLTQDAKNYITQLGAGVFQSNVFRAILGDLAKGELANYNKALGIANNTTNEAIDRNEQLNKTLDALFITTGNNFKQFAATIGNAGFTNNVRPIFDFLNKELTSISSDVAQTGGEAIGSKVALGIVDGLGKFFTGPGGAAIAIIFGKLLVNLVQFIPQALERTLVSSKAVESSFASQNSILAQRGKIYDNVNAKAISGVEQVRKLELEQASQSTNIINNQVALLNSRKSIQESLVSSAQKELAVQQQILAVQKEQIAANSIKVTQANQKGTIFVPPEKQRNFISGFVSPQLGRFGSPDYVPPQPPTPLTLDATDNVRRVLESEPPRFDRRANRFIGINPNTGRKGFLSREEGLRQGGLLPGQEQLGPEGINLLRQGAAQDLANQRIEAEKKLTALTAEEVSRKERLNAIRFKVDQQQGDQRARNELRILKLQENEAASLTKRQAIQIQIDQLKAREQSVLQANLIRLEREASSALFGGRSRKELVALAKTGDAGAAAALDRSNQTRQAAQSRIQSGVLGAAILAPIIESTLSRIAFDDDQSGRRGKSITNVIGQGLSGAATGALLGSLVLPGLGTAAGAGIGAAAGGLVFSIENIIDAIKGWNDVLPDLQKRIESITESSERLKEFFTQFTNIVQALQNPDIKPDQKAQLEKRLTDLSLTDPKLFNEIAKQFKSSGGNLTSVLDLQKIKSEALDFEKSLNKLSAFIQEKFINDNSFVETIRSPRGNNAGLDRNISFEPGVGNPFSDTGGSEIALRSLTEEGQKTIKDFLTNIFASGLNDVFENSEQTRIFTQQVERKGVTGNLNVIVDALERIGKADVGKQLAESVKNISPENQKLIAKEIEKLLTDVFAGTPDNVKQVSELASKTNKTLNNSFKDLQKIIDDSIPAIEEFGRSINNISANSLRNARTTSEINQTSAEGNLRRQERFLLPEEAEVRRSGINRAQIEDQFQQTRLNQAGQVAAGISGVGQSQFERIESELAKQENRNDTNNLALLEGINQFRQTLESFSGNLAETGQVDETQFKALQNLLNSPIFTDPQNESTRQELRGVIKSIKDFQVNNENLTKDQIAALEIESAKLQERLKEISLGFREIAKGRFTAGQISGRELATTLASRRSDELRKASQDGNLSNFNINQNALEAFRAEFQFNTIDLYQDIQDGAAETANNIKSSFKDAISSIISGAASIEDAFRQMVLNITTQILEKTTSIGVDSLLGGLFNFQTANKGGMIKKYSSGGIVNGGSGVKDDVPALLRDGEFVITNRAVDKYGTSFFNQLNSGVSVGLNNRFDYNDPRRPTGGSLNINPNLSSIGLEDSNNPQNAIRQQRQDTLTNYLKDLEAYEEQKRKELRAFRRQKQGILFSSYISAATNVAGGYLGSRNSSVQNTFNSGVSGGNFNVPAGIDDRILQANSGGLIKKFANGGNVFGGQDPRDNIPALLTGGEFVIRKEVVDRYGKQFFDNINTMQFANGGYVEGGRNSGASNIGETMSSLKKSIDELRSVISGGNTSNSPRASGGGESMTVYNTTHITLNENGSTSVNSSVSSNSKQDQENKQQQLKELSKMIEAGALKVIIEQKRPNKLLDFRAN